MQFVNMISITICVRRNGHECDTCIGRKGSTCVTHGTVKSYGNAFASNCRGGISPLATCRNLHSKEETAGDCSLDDTQADRG